MEKSARASAGGSAILLGDPDEVGGFDASHFQSILWFGAAPDSFRPLPVADAAVVHPVPMAGINVVDVTSALGRFQRLDPFQIPHLFVSRGFVSANAGDAAMVLAQVQSWLERRHGDRALLPRVGFARQKNFLLNVSDYVRRRVPAAWAGALRGLPAFVCGAGPSLDVSVAALAPVADRGVVIGADTALHALARFGVEVDFAVSTGSRKSPDCCLPSGMERARVIVGCTSPARWREAIAPDRLCFLSQPHSTGDWLLDFGVAPAAIEAAENCGLTALELARFLGCAPIHLFGLDLALDSADPDCYRTVDADAAIERAAPPAIADLPRVPGNYAIDVPTPFYAAWQACDARLAAWPFDLLRNVNDRGARLRNTRLVHPRQFTVPEGGEGKRRALAQLATPTVMDGAAAREACAAIGAQGAIGCRVVADLRDALRRGGVGACENEFRELFARRGFARAFGSFTERICSLPLGVEAHPPEFWSGQIDELEELSCLAEAVYDVSLV